MSQLHSAYKVAREAWDLYQVFKDPLNLEECKLSHLALGCVVGVAGTDLVKALEWYIKTAEGTINVNERTGSN